MLSCKFINFLQEQIDSIPNEDLCGIPLNENTFTDVVVDKVSAVIRKLKELAVNIYNKLKSAAKTAKAVIKEFFSKPASSQNPNSPANPRWGRSVIETVRMKARNSKYESKLEIHKWDSRYIDSLSDKLDRFDRVQIQINGKPVVIAAAGFLDSLQDGIDTNTFDLDIQEKYEDAVRSQYPKIFQTASSNPSSAELMERCGGSGDPLQFVTSTALVEDMIKCIESVETDLYNISIRYRKLTRELELAEKKIEFLKLTVPADSARATRFINQFNMILSDKMKVVNLVESVNVKCINMRSKEYMSQLIQYANE